MVKFSYKYLEDEWTREYWKFVCDNSDKNLDWDYISQNPSIPWDIIKMNPNIDEYWNNMSYHPNVPWEIIQNNSDKSWDWNYISRYNPNITWEIIQNNPNIDWDWNRLSSNPNITWDIIQNNPDKPWDWEWVSENPNITWEIIQNNPDKPWLNMRDKWYVRSCWRRFISGNTMEKGKEKWINDKRLHIIKVLQIQRHWRNCSCNPEYILARRLILKWLND